MSSHVIDTFVKSDGTRSGQTRGVSSKSCSPIYHRRRIMTETETLPTTLPTDDWNAEFDARKARFPKVKDSIVFAI